jgi:hypothetical protein
VYRDVVEVMFAIVNGDLDPGLLDPFPRRDFTRWSDWTTAAFAHIDVDTEFRLTDQAFRRVAAMLVSSELLAAKIQVNRPSKEDVELVQSSLKVIGEAVAADGRFHAVLGIAAALSSNMGGSLRA